MPPGDGQPRSPSLEGERKESLVSPQAEGSQDIATTQMSSLEHIKGDVESFLLALPLGSDERSGGQLMCVCVCFK